MPVIEIAQSAPSHWEDPIGFTLHFLKVEAGYLGIANEVSLAPEIAEEVIRRKEGLAEALLRISAEQGIDLRLPSFDPSSYSL